MARKIRKKSFWSTVPGIITAVTGLITAIGGLITVLYSAGIIGGATMSPPPSNGPRSVDTVSGSGASPSLTTSPPSAVTSDGCLREYFQGIPPNRIFVLEEGTRDVRLVGREQTKEAPVGLRLMDSRQLVGAFRFSFFLNGEIFKIESVIDHSCRPIEDYSVEGRPGEKRVLQNWDVLRVKIGSQSYALELGYSEGEISGDFVKFVP